MMWNGKKKAVTFSYDDGVVMDRQLVEIFNRYGMKGTFNLNSGIQSGSGTFQKGDVLVRRMNIKGLKELYQGHEIACHALTHADLTRQDEETVYNEIQQDKTNLENMFECEIRGMAYPFGTLNEDVMKIAADCGIGYARTVLENGRFDISANLLALEATAHHNREDLLTLVRDFTLLETKEPQMLYIWGHSYEFAVDDNWNRIEEICRILEGRDDIFYGTNAEVLLDR